MCLSSSYVKILSLIVMILGNESFGNQLGQKGEALVNRIIALARRDKELALTLPSHYVRYTDKLTVCNQEEDLTRSRPCCHPDLRLSDLDL